MAISKIRITAGQLLPRVREAAKTSSNVVIIPAPLKKSMAGMMNYLQILKCLRDGEIVGKPVLNEHGDWAFRMQRCAATLWLEIDVVAVVSGTRVTKLYVLLES